MDKSVYQMIFEVIKDRTDKEVEPLGDAREKSKKDESKDNEQLVSAKEQCVSRGLERYCATREPR